MRKALITLFGASLVGALLVPSCVIKEEGDDDSDSGGSAGEGGASATLTTGGGGLDAGGASGSSSTSSADACPDLVITNTGTGETCSMTNQSAQYNDINMLIVLDKSTSMQSVPDGFSTTKWEAARTALQSALNSSTEQVKFGLLMYPFSETSTSVTCELPTGSEAVNVAVGSGTVDTIISTLGETTPQGGTPTAAALQAAYEYYTTGDGSELTGKKYVLLVTDGGPNCNADATCDASTCTANIDQQGSCGTTAMPNCCDAKYTSSGAGALACVDDQGVLTQINALSASEISTFVVGIPGVEAYASYLTTFANAGGVPDPNDTTTAYYAVTADQGVEGLTDTFKGITETLVRDCVVELATEPLDANLLNVAVECSPLGASNWTYELIDGTPTITISGDTCTRIETEGVTRIDVIEGCPKIEIY